MNSCTSLCAPQPTSYHSTSVSSGLVAHRVHVPHCTQWPSQQRHKVSCNTATASMTPDNTHHPTCYPSVSSNCDCISQSHHSRHSRTAVVTFSMGNGRSNESNSSSSSQPQMQADRSQRWQVLSQQQQQPQWANSNRLLQQRQAAAAREQQLQQQQWQYQQQTLQQQQQMQGYTTAADTDGQDMIMPRQRFVFRSYNTVRQQDWYKQPPLSTDPKALQAAVLQRCGRGFIEPAALKHLMVIASDERDAQMVLSAVAAVRAVAVSRGKMQPWPDPFLKQFVRMCVSCDCHEVLVSAMQRPAELGFMFKWKTLLVALKYWGDHCDVDKLQQIAFVMEDAGLVVDERLAYVVLRAAVNASCDNDRINMLLTWFESKGVGREQFRPALIRLLEKGGAAAAAAVGDGSSSSDT